MLMAALRMSLLIGTLMAALMSVSLTLWQGANVHELAFTFDNAIYRLDLNTGIQFRVTAQNRSHNPVWSPDGERIVFTATVTEVNYGSDIFIVDADGSNLRNLTINMNNRDSEVYSSDAVWSPDGRQIALASDWGAAYLQIFTLNLDTGSIRHISSDSNYNDNPTWSPDGDEIAFDASWNLHIVDAHQNPLSSVVEFGIAIQNLVWSPDGLQIALEAGEDGQSIYLANRDGTQMRELTYGRMPAWSPDGRYIAYTYADYMPTYHYLFAIADVQSGVVQVFPQSYLFVFNPSWSPSGELVAFGCQDNQVNYSANICFLNVDTGTIVTTAYRIDLFSPLAWRP